MHGQIDIPSGRQVNPRLKFGIRQRAHYPYPALSSFFRGFAQMSLVRGTDSLILHQILCSTTIGLIRSVDETLRQRTGSFVDILL